MSGPVPVPGSTTRVLSVAGKGLQLTFGPGHEALAGEITALWAHLEDSAAEVDLHRTVLAQRDPSCPATTVIPPGPSAAYRLSGMITRAVIEELIGTRLLLHAGAVDHPQLGVMLLVGPSGAGKSTAATVLGRSGTYLSDELAIIDPITCALTAFPKPVSRLGADGVKRDVALDELELAPPASVSAAEPGRIVLLDRIPAEGDRGDRDRSVGAAEQVGTIRRLPLELALPRIIEQSSSLARLPEGLASLAALLTRAGGALQVRYREAEELPVLLAEAPAVLEEAWEALPATAAAPAMDGAAGPGTVSVAPFDQALALESGVVVLDGTRAAFLSGLAGLVWDSLRRDGALTAGELDRVLSAEIGAHPRSRALVEEAVGELARGRWVQRR